MNKALTSEYAWNEFEVMVQKMNYKTLQIALNKAGYSLDRLAILEPSCSTNLMVYEKRKAEFVKTYIMALGTGIDLDTYPDIRDCDLSSVDGTARSGTFATLTTALAGGNNDLIWQARNRGTMQNMIRIRYADPGANNAVLSLELVETTVVVHLATDGAGVITTTANQIKTALSANDDINVIVGAAHVSGSTGDGVVTAMAATNLTGGTNW